MADKIRNGIFWGLIVVLTITLGVLIYRVNTPLPSRGRRPVELTYHSVSGQTVYDFLLIPKQPNII